MLCRILLNARYVLLLGDSQLQTYDNGCAGSRRSDHFNGTAHQVDNAFGDRHPQSGSFYTAYGRSTFAFKGSKNLISEFSGHTDPVVLYSYLIGTVTVFPASDFKERSGAGEVESAHSLVRMPDIDHAVQVFPVAPDILVLYLAGMDLEIQVLLPHLF